MKPSHTSPKKPVLIRIATVPHSLGGLLRGQLRFMSEYYEVVGISSSSEGHLEVVGEQEGVRTHVVEMTRKITPFKDLRALFQLLLIFYREKPYIVHTHTPKAGTLGMMAAYMARVPHRLHTVAGMPLLEATGSRRKLLNLVERLTYRCATRVLPNSFGLKDIILAEKFTKAEKLHVIGKGSSNGIDTAHFDPDLFDEAARQATRQELGIPEDHFIFIFLGRLVTDKGINELVSAFCRLNSEFPKTTLLLLGDYERHLDPLHPDTEARIDTEAHIVYPGGKKDVRPYFAMADLLVFPSYREGFPNVVMEAAAMGLASIVSDINGCNEIIEEEVNGLIVPVKSVEALYTAMRRMLTQGDLRERMAGQARASIQQRYERRFIWNELYNYYQELQP